ncbi:MAG TPA: heparan-alpha-glucosaminide N-acetyltransferase domain-containing protein [Steroidobacteraceae bacterium]
METQAAAHAPVVQTPAAAVARALGRIEAIDLVRGLIIILMALDHTRDYFGDIAAQPTNLAATTTALFFTRWITHFCAPVFFLLTGTGAYLLRGRVSLRQLSRFLLTRGAWLLLLELTVMRFALQFNIDYQVTIITVLWGLGWAMIVLAGLIWLPMWAIAAIGAILVGAHNTLDGIEPAAFGVFAPLWSILHVPGVILDTGRSVVLVSYVLIPWVGVTALGYILGQLYHWDADRRRSLLFWLGVALCVGFVALRFTNIYGDPVPWSQQKAALWTVMSFLNVNKYPPSLLFLLMTLGPALLLLRAFDRGVPEVLRPALIIGKVPLFFYVLHFYLIHLLAVVASYLRYGEAGEMFQSPDVGHFPFSAPPGWGNSLPVVYLIWALVVLIMFPLCRWYAGVKKRGSEWWLSYL